jgi:hypothetical protein
MQERATAAPHAAQKRAPEQAAAKAEPSLAPTTPSYAAPKEDGAPRPVYDGVRLARQRMEESGSGLQYSGSSIPVGELSGRIRFPGAAAPSASVYLEYHDRAGMSVSMPVNTPSCMPGSTLSPLSCEGCCHGHVSVWPHACGSCRHERQRDEGWQRPGVNLQPQQPGGAAAHAAVQWPDILRPAWDRRHPGHGQVGHALVACFQAWHMLQCDCSQLIFCCTSCSQVATRPGQMPVLLPSCNVGQQPGRAKATLLA